MELDASDRLKVGQIVEVEIGAIAHGGHFVARYQGQVIFVRHAISGEVCKIKITAVNSKIAQADVVEVLTPSAVRVTPPCKYAGVCGGCDFQHISIAAQLKFKREIVLEQFLRIGKIDLIADGFDFQVQQLVPTDGLHWRTRMDFAVSPSGKIGFLAHAVIK